ncbi:MAG TPA: PIG-L family deacetylase [Chitinophagaceae bacterium]|nr:PIG-L family deacetylase [Chitinophagaceae bacterium]
MRTLFILCLLCFTSYIHSQSQTTATATDIYLGLKKLNVLGSVLYVAAHPDDENTRLLTYFSKDRLYRTAYLSLTRGDGGQNLIGDEQGIPLGLIRTQELLAARRIDGAEQFFTRAYDFGFSKNPQETFTKWNKEKVLGDVVWVIRKFQPDVIITRFPVSGEGGHGHHTASAILANEAFSAAGDPTKFPEQLKYTQPWQAKRIVWNTFNFGGTNTQRSDQFSFDVGGYNPIIGKSYGELAAESRSQHKSQGFGVPSSRGEALEYFSTTGGTAPRADIMDDVITSWKRLNGRDEISQLVAKAVSNFEFEHPEKSLPSLIEIRKALRRLPNGFWKNQKLAEVEALVAQCSGLWMEATTSVAAAVQDDSLRINVSVNNRSGSGITLKTVSVAGFDSSFNTKLPLNKNLSFSKTILVPADKTVTQPYWLSSKMQEGMFVIEDQQLVGQPDVSPAFEANFVLRIADEEISYSRPVQYKSTHPVRGEKYQPLVVIPAVTLFSQPDVVVLPKGTKQSREVVVQLASNKTFNTLPLQIELRAPDFYAVKKDTINLWQKGLQKSYSFSINSDKNFTGKQNLLKPFAGYSSGKTPVNAYLSTTGIHYDHIPDIRYFYSDDIKVLNIDLETRGKKIGYIVGAGDKVPEALEQMGFEVTLLSEKELSRHPLSQYDAIISGVRAYNTNEWLSNHYDQLMKYVEDGGNFIVQYNTSNQIGSVRSKIGPYNFGISRTRVTDENATVSFVNPAHSVLNVPNKINEQDFAGWVQERSIYHATDWDKNFEPILTISDPGEQPDAGSLIIARHGKGFFTYTGLVFFRQLPAGVPGAYRLLANLIALNQKQPL